MNNLQRKRSPFSLFYWTKKKHDGSDPFEKDVRPEYLSTHPAGHLVCVGLAVVVVEDHDGGHHGARHHEHDAVEVGS